MLSPTQRLLPAQAMAPTLRALPPLPRRIQSRELACDQVELGGRKLHPTPDTTWDCTRSGRPSSDSDARDQLAPTIEGRTLAKHLIPVQGKAPCRSSPRCAGAFRGHRAPRRAKARPIHITGCRREDEVALVRSDSGVIFDGPLQVLDSGSPAPGLTEGLLRQLLLVVFQLLKRHHLLRVLLQVPCLKGLLPLLLHALHCRVGAHLFV
mmetsp:Transcript_102499/g.235157  ORF Transcript_102499/g.235157 Transcript_102499/m.235157 type:complete len:208 (-) Transcript_102499:1233-1856(-)